MISIWEKESFISYDIIIVGAGITGLSTAASLKEKSPNLDILILERGLLPTGASTKNAGFACFGSISELSNDRKLLGDEGMVELVNKRWSGLQKTISRLGKEPIGLEEKGGYELLAEANSPYLKEMNEINSLLSGTFRKPVFNQYDQKLRSFGFTKTHHLVFNSFEGQLHTGKLIKSLWEYCNKLGVKIITGAKVTSHYESEHTVDILTDTLTFKSKKVVFCTNSFTTELFPNQMDITPGRGMVMLIKPSKPLRFEGTFHMQEGYYYFRDFKNMLLFGGGRNVDFEGEKTTRFGINEKIQASLHALLGEVILPECNYETEMVWSGIMAFGRTKQPVVEQLNDRVYVGARLGGMGVAIGSMVGEELANLVLESSL